MKPTKETLHRLATAGMALSSGVAVLSWLLARGICHPDAQYLRCVRHESITLRDGMTSAGRLASRAYELGVGEVWQVPPVVIGLPTVLAWCVAFFTACVVFRIMVGRNMP